MAIEIEISSARCIASKACTHAAEGVFEIVGSTARVVDPAAAPVDDVLATAESCPTGAITVRENGRQLA